MAASSTAAQAADEDRQHPADAGVGFDERVDTGAQRLADLELPFDLDDIIHRALIEDVGSGDVTSLATVAEGTMAVGHVIAKADGVSDLGETPTPLRAPVIFLVVTASTARPRWPEICSAGSLPYQFGKAYRAPTASTRAISRLAHQG